ncbi:MAG: Uma2 family endonuclease [Acidobacteria bacterium]|nr:Uma2 family endonuclease [Acidobacteriota bacterium]
MGANPAPVLTPAAYLELERASDIQHEYVNGQMFAMSGGTANHSFLITAIARDLSTALMDRPCDVSVTSLRLQVTPEGAYLYPGIMVICGSPQYADGHRDMILNPTVIVEVLSDTTERWDRVGKFAQYRRVPSLREYILVSQDEMRVEWFTYREDIGWLYQEAMGPESPCKIDSIDVTLSLARIYRRIELPPAPPSQPASIILVLTPALDPQRKLA